MNINFEKLKNELTNEEFLNEIPKMEEEFSKHKIVDLEKEDVVLIEKISKKTEDCNVKRFRTYYIFKTKENKYIVLLNTTNIFPLAIYVTNENPIDFITSKNNKGNETFCNILHSSYVFPLQNNWTESEYKNSIYSCLLEYKNDFLYRDKNEITIPFYKFFSIMNLFKNLYDNEFADMLEEYNK